ncbi:MAG: monovalent cation/H+ antiporter complex subunit F [Defluviitaleaceae bacterium]|nr:monovalent cation/H+ antiporter complex subunit F [Defluviitaleaceae bacterium]
MMNIILIVLFAYLFFSMIRVAIGPSVWDRLSGLNLVTTKIILVIVIFASINETTYLLDFAMIYALSGFIGTIFITLFLSNRNRRKLEEFKEDAETEQENE